MSLAVSPLAPEEPLQLSPVKGVRLSAVSANIRYKDRLDLMLAELVEGTTVAGVFTQSTTAAASVNWCRNALKTGTARAVIVNAGNANALTGDAGRQAVEETVAAVSTQLTCEKEQVFVSSTGVIGQPLPTHKIVAALPRLQESLRDNGWMDAANAIRTTDTFVKTASRKVLIGDDMVHINGFAKGSGMIAPNMATMLGYVFTDAAVSQGALQDILNESNEVTFNSITVDGDTSTNDMVLAFATAQAGNTEIADMLAPHATAFVTALQEVLGELALQIVRDGEGASKLIMVDVLGAKSYESAKTIAMSIANSPLVKTAIAGEDPNWGRIAMAIGKTNEPIDLASMTIAIGPYQITRGDSLIDDYDEAPVAEYMKGQEINITVSVGNGRGTAKVWTCDLTHDYITINGDYRS